MSGRVNGRDVTEILLKCMLIYIERPTKTGLDDGMNTLRCFTLAGCLAVAPALYANECDRLAALAADQDHVGQPVDYRDLQADAVIQACDQAIAAKAAPLGRYYLQRGRGYLKARDFDRAWQDWSQAAELDYPAAFFAMGSAYLIADYLDQDFEKAQRLYRRAFELGVPWAARGLARIYENPNCACFDLDEAEAWEARFLGE